MNPTASAELMAALCDTLLPGDGHFPKASLTGTQAIAASRLRARYGGDIFDQLARDLSIGETGFADSSHEDRVTAVEALQTAKPDFFTFLLAATYLAYYATPPVIEAIRLDGHIYNDAPLPLGYDLPIFSFTPGLEVPLEPKGTFKWTDQMEPIDISGLADLDLPVTRNAR